MNTNSGIEISTSFAHHRIGALDEQVEDAFAHAEVAEEQAQRHQREGDREAQHHEEQEQARACVRPKAASVIAWLPVQRCVPRMRGLVTRRCPAASAARISRPASSASFLGRLGGRMICSSSSHVGQALRPLAGLDALDAAHHLDEALQQHQDADDRDQALERPDDRAVGLNMLRSFCASSSCEEVPAGRS